MKIAIVNHTDFDNGKLHAAGQAMHEQITHEVAPLWGKRSVPVMLDDTPGELDWEMHLFDDADQAGALGYHDVTPQGKPYGKVFRKVSEENGISVSSVMDHEVLEMYLDPFANYWADYMTAGESHALEACDAVEDGVYFIGGMRRRGVELSNWLYPAYFIDGAAGPYDHLHALTAPFTRTPGGYSIIMQDGRVKQVFGEQYPDWKRALKQFPASRTARRSLSG